MRGQLREFRFKIEEPADKVMCTKVWLIGWTGSRRLPDGTRAGPVPAELEHVMQIPWKWLYRRNIESAKKTLIKRYLKHIRNKQPDNSWEESASGEYTNDVEKELLL